jgi:hypothetical protein
MKIRGLISLFIVLVLPVRAEFRIWTDVNDNVLEGEFLVLSADLVVIQNQAGEKFSFKMEELSKEDQTYVESRLLPELDMDVSKIADTVSRGGRLENIQCRAVIRQTSCRPYKGELRASLMVIGENERDGSLYVENRQDIVFYLPDNRGDPIEFHSQTCQFRRTSQNKPGRRYFGYLLIVKTEKGQTVTVKSNRRAIEARLAEFEVFRTKKKP